MTPTSRRLTATAFLLCILGASAPAFAQFAFLFGGRGGTDFTSEDWSMFSDAMRKVLNEGETGSRGDWSNPKTGLRGDMTIEGAYERDGLSCRHVRFNIMRAQNQNPYQMNFCKTDRGTWAIAP